MNPIRSGASFDRSGSGASWDAYWQGSGAAEAWSTGGVGHPAIREFWLDFLRDAAKAFVRPALLDIASGNGAVVETALGLFAGRPLDIRCVDLSAAAVANIRRRFPSVQGLVCDARSIPLPSGTCDLVTSQFGVDYAGPGAAAEAARLVTAGGRLALLLHHHSGALYDECVDSLDAVSRLRDADFIPRAIAMFRAGFAAVRGGDRGPYEVAATQLAPAARVLEEIIAERGESVAGGTLATLYAGVARIHDRLPHYDPDDVIAWLTRMDDELAPFAGRLASMLDCALDQEAFDGVCGEIRDAGVTIEQGGPLQAPGGSRPLAWAVVATRSPASKP